MSYRKDWTGIILAGGRSSRMRSDKALLRIGDETMLQHTVGILEALVDSVLIVGRADDQMTTAIAVPDDCPGTGPLGGLATGLRHMRSPHALVVAVDHPYLNTDVLRYLQQRLEYYDAAVPIVDGQPQPTHAVYGRHCLPMVEQHLGRGQRSLRRLLDELTIRRIEAAELESVAPGHQSFLNVNTAEDWSEIAGW